MKCLRPNNNQMEQLHFPIGLNHTKKKLVPFIPLKLKDILSGKAGSKVTNLVNKQSLK